MSDCAEYSLQRKACVPAAGLIVLIGLDLEAYRCGCLVLGNPPHPSARARVLVLPGPRAASLLSQDCAFPQTLLQKPETWHKGTARYKEAKAFYCLPDPV